MDELVWDVFWIAMTAAYWIGVFTGSLSHVHYTNSNMDTFLHGGFATFGLVFVVFKVRQWNRRAKEQG